MKNRVYLFVCVTLGLMLSGCSMQKLTMKAMDPVIDGSMQALFAESDLVIARSAIEADLKLLDGMLVNQPKNRKLLFFAAQGYTSYALGFVEDESVERARVFYLRGRAYGLKLLERNRTFTAALNKPLAEFTTALQTFKPADVPALFWAANAWGNWINISMTDPDAIVGLPKVEAMMRRVIEGYFYGGAHLFLGTILIAKPMMMGGNPEKSKAHFERCFEFAGDEFLLPYAYYAQFYAPLTLDEALFDEVVEKVINTSPDVLPEQCLPNAIARAKVQRLKAQRDDLF